MDSESKLRAKMANDTWFELQNSPTISKRYSNVNEIVIKMNFCYDNNYRNEKIIKLLPTDKAFFKFECINKDCICGGFNIYADIDSVIKDKRIHFESQQTCSGYQDYERFKAKNYHCLCKLYYIVNIVYVITK